MIPLESGSIHVFHTSLDIHSGHHALFQSWLSDEEKIRAEKIKLPYRQHFILARGLLRQLLSIYSKLPPEKIQFSYTEQGKPIFANSLPNKSIEFNLSHSRERVAFAFTLDTPIGIDLEYKVQRKHMDKIAYRFFPAHQYEQLSHLTGEKKLNAFFNAWVHNEASLKALGYRLQTHPFSKYKTTKSSTLIDSQQLGFRQHATRMSNHSVCRIHENCEPSGNIAENLSAKSKKEKNPCSLSALTIHPNFAAAVAIKGHSKPIIVKECSYLLNSININRTTPQTTSSACISIKG